MVQYPALQIIRHACVNHGVMSVCHYVDAVLFVAHSHS
jgi:hypothetical protein